MIRIKTELAGKYSVLLGKGISENTVQFMKEEGISGVKKIMIVSDSNVYPLYGEKLKSVLKEGGYDVYDFVFPAGEHSKTGPTVEKLWEKSGECNFTSRDLMIALGGGVAGDITGFAACTYLGGIRFIQMPTSLLAMTECMIGGRNGLTLASGKNLAGTVWHPSLIITDTAFLDTLPKHIFNEGMAEAIKIAVTASSDLYSLIMKEKPDIEKIIALSVYEKNEILEKDDKDALAKLEFGHTAADSIESEYDISHGKAVALGMLLTTRAAVRKGICTTDTERKLLAMLEKYSLPTDTAITEDNVGDYIINEKRREGDILAIALPEKIGKCIIIKINISHYEKYFKKQ